MSHFVWSGNAQMRQERIKNMAQMHHIAESAYCQPKTEKRKKPKQLHTSKT